MLCLKPSLAITLLIVFFFFPLKIDFTVNKILTVLDFSLGKVRKAQSVNKNK